MKRTREDENNSHTTTRPRRDDENLETRPTKQLKSSQHSADNATVVAQHYNARPEIGRERRRDSPILHLKNFNNWVKAVMINKYAGRGFSALDFCCGKGGDLLKWSKAQIAYLVGVDIAAVSIEQAQQRYNQGRGNRFKALFFAADCFATPISERLPPGHKFDLVSCQFAFHYSFETEAKARMALENVTKHLRPGGHFIGTIPNANWIVKKIRKAEGLSFGNSILTITFEKKDPFARFGHKYWFELKDAIDNCPEYLVHFPTLEQ